MRPRISIRGLVRPSVGWSVTLSSKSMKYGHFRILNDLDNAGRGRKRDEEEGGGRKDKEEGGMRRKEGRGVLRDAEKGATWMKER